MESLPDEILDKIFSYLEVGDLLNCSKVSTSWRNVGNMNHLWKKHCEKRFSVDPIEKPEIELGSFVKPLFEIPANGSDRLTDVCPWRIRYAQEVHIMNNFIEGRYETGPISGAIPDHVSTAPFRQIGEKLVSLQHFFLEVWIFIDEGMICEETIETGLPYPIEFFFPMKNGFSFTINNIIFHYSMKNGKFVLKLQTAIEKPLIDSRMPNIIDIFDIEIFSTRLPPFDTENLLRINSNDRYLIFVHGACKIIRFLVWDLEILQPSVFRLNLDNNFEHHYMGFSDELISKYFVSLFYPCSDKLQSDTIFIFDLKNPGAFEKAVVEPINGIFNIRPTGDFIAIGYEDRISFVRGGQTVSIKCDVSGPGFYGRVIKTDSYVCALGRRGEVLELIQADLHFNLVRRIDVRKSVMFFFDYSLHTIGQDYVSVGSLFRTPLDVGQLMDLKRQRSTDLPINVLALASPTNKLNLLDTVSRQAFFFW